MYDIAIIGAGINGCSVAYELAKSGKNVVVFDEVSIAGGGSGAAGAFISPKFSKSGELKELLNDAFVYSMDFYEKNFPKYLSKTSLLHIAQDEKSSDILKLYKSSTKLKLKTPSDKVLNSLSKEAKEKENIYLDAGIVDSQAICNSMLKSSQFIKEKIEDLNFDNGIWILNKTYKAKQLILATGAYKSLLNEAYINLRGIWGHRIDIKTSTKNEVSIHQFVSISPSKDGVISIGATHNVHFHPQINQEPYNVKEGRTELLEKASRTLKLENIEIIKDYTGLRSGSVDYLPLLGRVVDSKKTLSDKKINFQLKKVNLNDYSYYENLYIINGSAGYGFVLAPYLAKMLKEHIVESKEIDKKLNPARFFSRWARKLL